MIKVLCIMGKSGSGKSTIANRLMALVPEKYALVKSFTTRKERENDPEDVKTHIFVSEEDYQKDRAKVVALYESPLGYKSYVTKDLFDVDKVNIFVIDPRAYSELIVEHSDELDIVGVYIAVSEDERMLRLKKRGSDVSKYLNEEHLSEQVVTALCDTYRLDTTKMSVMEAAVTIDAYTYHRRRVWKLRRGIYE